MCCAHARTVPTRNISADVRDLGESFVFSTAAIVRRSRVSRSEAAPRLHDSVSVLVSGPRGQWTVHTHDMRRGEYPSVAFFFVVGLPTAMYGRLRAILQSYEPRYVVHYFRSVQGCCLLLKLKPTVRRALDVRG